MKLDSKIFVAGHRGLVGSAIVRRLRAEGYSRIEVRTRREVDLTDARAVSAFFEAERPEYIFLAAAKVGGILANDTYPADFLRDNLAIELNVLDASWRHGARKVQFLGSSCIYPKMAPQPIREEYLLTGALEPTNQWYAIAKIAGLMLGQAYRKQHGFPVISLMPTNLYGPGDNFDLKNSHVLPALMRKFHEAKVSGAAEVVVWGSGTPRREFLHVDDLASAAVFLMREYDAPEIVNCGVGEDVSIAEAASLMKRVVGFEGKIVYDSSKPDGTPRKLLDVSRLHSLGWKAGIGLEEGLTGTYQWYLEHAAAAVA
ncbi:MAG: GDP-L-fucose synthase [Bryobacterales bacterium]|nr:GDP-L-fucose synthase [Bryobacterales bacterium]